MGYLFTTSNTRKQLKKYPKSILFNPKATENVQVFRNVKAIKAHKQNAQSMQLKALLSQKLHTNTQKS